MSELFYEIDEVIRELPKSKILASSADLCGEYLFYLSGLNHSRIGDYLLDGEAIVMGDGGVASVSYAKGKFSYSSHNWVFDSKSDDVLTKYLFRLIEFFIEKINYSGFVGSGIKNIDKNYFRKIKILRVPLGFQKQVIEYLDDLEEALELNTLLKIKNLNIRRALINSPQPDGHKLINLEDIVERIIDCEHKTAPSGCGTDYFVVGTGDVKDGKIIFDGIRTTSKDAYDEWTRRGIPSCGDVLFTREAPAGQSALVPKNLKICLGQRMVLLKPKKNIDGSYLNNYLQSNFAQNQIFKLSIGTTVGRINIEDIKKIKIIPMNEESQSKLVKKIALLDKKIALLDEKIRKLNFIKNAYMQTKLSKNIFF